MYKMTVTYEDLNGEEQTREAYFNFSKMEIIRIQTEEGGFVQYLERILNESDMQKIMEVFEWFVQKAYGEKSSDGSRFIKVDQNGTPLIDSFKNTQVYDEILFKLCTDEGAAADFVGHVVPQKELQEAITKMQEQKKNNNGGVIPLADLAKAKLEAQKNS